MTDEQRAGGEGLPDAEEAAPAGENASGTAGGSRAMKTRAAGP